MIFYGDYERSLTYQSAQKLSAFYIRENKKLIFILNKLKETLQLMLIDSSGSIYYLKHIH